MLSYHTETQSSRSNVWNGQIRCSHGNGTFAYQFFIAYRRDRNRSVDMFSICLLSGDGTEQLLIAPLFVTLFGRSIFWNGTVLFEVFQRESNPSAFHFLEQYGTK